MTLVGQAAFEQHWPPDQCVLWLLENTLKPLDIGDVMQVFEVRLHELPRNTANGLLALSFRLLVASYFVALIFAFRILVFGDVGMSVYDLAGMLDSRYRSVRRRAARCLARIEVAEDAVGVLPSLHAALRGADPLVQLHVLALLARLGPPAFDPAMAALLQHPLDLVWHPASRCLARMGELAIGSLETLVASADATFAKRGIETLVRTAELDRTLAPKIRDLLTSATTREADVREAVAAALAQVGQIAA